MPRAKPEAVKAKDGTIEIDTASLIRTRDSLVTGLATVQDALQTISTGYIKQINELLGEHGGQLDLGALSKLNENPIFTGNLPNLARGASPAKSATGDAAAEKKERKKRQHDPNAPKRPLTPFFLYMQTARPIIATDLGPDVPKGAVSNEGTRRWGSMAPDDKQLWTNAYKDNLRLYNARMHSYKVGHNENAKDMTDQEALTYAEQNNIGAEATADAQLVGEANAGALLDVDADAEGEVEKEPTPPPKTTPKAKASRKKATKGTPAPAATPAEPETIVPPASSSIVPPKPAEKEKSPDKKRKRASKKADEPAAVEEKEAAVETPKSTPKPRKKKAKADA